MAQFPTTAPTFTTKSNGGIIDASHINDVQAEVAAIGDGYLNGTARLNAGASTLASLNVTGASTFATRPVMAPPDALRLQLDAAAEIPASTVAVSWTARAFITNSSCHSTASNPERFTPQSTGVYQFQLELHWRTNTSTLFTAAILDSSGGVISFNRVRPVNGNITQVACGLKRFDTLAGSTQWVRVRVNGNSTNSLESANGLTHWDIWKL